MAIIRDTPGCSKRAACCGKQEFERLESALERGSLILRKATLALALTAAMTLTPASLLLPSPIPGSEPQETRLAYAPLAMDFIFPVGAPYAPPTFAQGNANGYYISQMFNNSCDPSLQQGYSNNGVYYCGHTGVDLADNQSGGVVRAAANGVVVHAGYSNLGYGAMVRIQHLLSDGTYMYTQYEHLLYGSITVNPGEVVSIGQTVGAVGSTGFASGPHLHFEVKSVNEDGAGYTYGNAALIVGYYDPIAYVFAHLASPPAAAAAATATFAAPTATPIPAPATATLPPPPSATTAPPTPPSSTAPTAVAMGPVDALPPLVAQAQAVDVSPTPGATVDPLQAFNQQYSQFVTVTADRLYVRTGSSYASPTLGAVMSGARVAYLGMSGNGWVHIAMPGNVTGWVVRQWVDASFLPPLPSLNGAAVSGPYETVLDDRYPARSGPMMHDEAIEPLWVGEKLVYLDTKVSWDHVLLPSGRTGWVLNWYLQKPAAPATPTPAPMTPIPAPATPTPAPMPPATLTPARASQPWRARRARPHVAVGSPSRGSDAAVYVTGAQLRLHNGPRLGATTIDVLPLGTRLMLHGYHISWADVTTSTGERGYVLRTFVAPTPSSTASPPRGATERTVGRQVHPHVATRTQETTTATLPEVRVVVAAGVNLRRTAGTTAKVIIAVPKNTVLLLQGSNATGQWSFVETQDHKATGWVYRSFVAPVKTASTT